MNPLDFTPDHESGWRDLPGYLELSSSLEFCDFAEGIIMEQVKRISRERERWLSAWMAYIFPHLKPEDAKRLDTIQKWGFVIKRYPHLDELTQCGVHIASFKVWIESGHLHVRADYPKGFKIE